MEAEWRGGVGRLLSSKGLIMEYVCAALLHAYFPRVEMGAIDRNKLYGVPESYVARMSVAHRTTAKTCAQKYGLRYVIVDANNVPLKDQ